MFDNLNFNNCSFTRIDGIGN